MVLISVGAFAQSQNAMRINEFLVINTNDFQDDFGQQSPWIELFNSSHGTVDIGGCCLTDDPNNLMKYRIPKGDLLTKIKPRQHTLFWADNQPFRGTFHVNFDLTPGKEILFVASDGKTIIDRIIIPAHFAEESMENRSYGREIDGVGSINGDGEGWKLMERTSPSTNNESQDKETKSQKMQRIDPHGFLLSLTSAFVVFFALILLYRIFKRIGQLAVRKFNRKTKESNIPDVIKAKAASAEDVSSETLAAISMAFHLYQEENEAHDEESFIVTLQHTDRSYSPWSSKIYSLRDVPQLNRRK